MKSFPKIFVVLIFLGFLAPVLVLAQSLSLPNQFFGSVNFTNGVSPDGLVVEARIINGPVVGNSVTAGGNYGYNPNLLFALDNQGVYSGETVEFYVSGIKANETAVFVNGESTNLNLTISGTVGTIEETDPTPPPGGGGGVDGTPVSTTYKTGDMDKNNKVDVFDFNTLMVNWGNNPTNSAADLDGNGKVDIFDFNLLMVNWTL